MLRRTVAVAGLVAAACFSTSAKADEGASEAWHARYDAARAALVAGRYTEAADALDALADAPPTLEDRRRAVELAEIARAEAARIAPGNAASLRSSDELSVLYATSFVYGLGTSGWVLLQIKPKTAPAALFPFLGITVGAVGAVALADGYRPLRRGVAHAIAGGLYLGFGEGVWITGAQHAIAARRGDGSRWQAETTSTVLWAASTVGAVTGGVIGAVRQPTAGRVSFTASAAIWGGILASFTTGAFLPDDRRQEGMFLAAGAGYNAGIVAGIVAGPYVAPSVARARFLDLGGFGGTLLGTGIYAIVAQDAANARAGFGAGAAGAAAGLAVAWWATSRMPQDFGEPAGAAPPAVRLTPTVAPTAGGGIVGVAGAM